MNTKLVYVALVSGALGTAMGASYPALTAVAATDLSREQADRKPATEAQQAALEACVAPIVLKMANEALAIDKTAKALAIKPGACTIRAVNLSWELNDKGVCAMSVEYATQPIKGSWVVADPQ
jgi:hypothetical protein